MLMEAYWLMFVIPIMVTKELEHMQLTRELIAALEVESARILNNIREEAKQHHLTDKKDL